MKAFKWIPSQENISSGGLLLIHHIQIIPCTLSKIIQIEEFYPNAEEQIQDYLPLPRTHNSGGSLCGV